MKWIHQLNYVPQVCRALLPPPLLLCCPLSPQWLQLWLQQWALSEVCSQSHWRQMDAADRQAGKRSTFAFINILYLVWEEGARKKICKFRQGTKQQWMDKDRKLACRSCIEFHLLSTFLSSAFLRKSLNSGDLKKRDYCIQYIINSKNHSSIISWNTYTHTRMNELHFTNVSVTPLFHSSPVSYQREGCMSVGGSDLAIFSSTLMGFISWFGGSICASSIRVTPRDQMSAL